MYETWVKSLIDIVDELAPVTVVRNRLELPLGSVSGEMSTTISCRLDLADVDSPWCDMVVTERESKMMEIVYMIHVPNINRRTDEEIIRNVKSVDGVSALSLLSPVGDIGQETYVIRGTISTPLEHPTDNFNSATHDIAQRLVFLMQTGGYSDVQGQDGVLDDDLVTWPVE